MIEAKIICDSIGEHSPRLTTFQLRYPRFIHGEFMTHRTFSRNASSSRAIPVSKNLAEVRNDALRASPVYWGAEQKGMQSGDELDDSPRRFYECQGEIPSPRANAKAYWRLAALAAADNAEMLHSIGAHKSIVNRILEPFLHINVVMTSCEPGLLNFFSLRLDKAAQPEIRVLAETVWREWHENKPLLLKSNDWHLPFIEPEDLDLAGASKPVQIISDDQYIHTLIKISVARCARVSYLSFETRKRSTIEEDLKLYNRLIGSQPLHASPAEHQATPDPYYGHPIQETYYEKYGNLVGWIQYRKTLKGEAIAPLPEGFILK